MLCVGLLALLACENSVEINLSIAQSCSIPDVLKEAIGKNSNLKISGCLVAYWQSQPFTLNYGQAVSVSTQGAVTLLKRDNQSSGIQLPVSALDHPLLFRLYLFQTERAEGLDDDGHDKLCRTMSATDYNCFDKPQDCWLAFELQPSASHQGKELKTLPVSDDESQRCTVCRPEVCGDGIDNDCNGQIDEFDAVKKIPCPQAP